MVFPIKVYYNTGLYVDNCLDSLALLDTLGFESKSFEAVWLLQNRDLREVKIATTYDNIQNADYVVIKDTGYWVMGITMLNENVCSLSLQTDYVTSIGVSNIEIISGWCTRRCVVDDTPFTNTITEPFSPERELVIDYGKLIKPSTHADIDYQIMVSTVDLLAVGETAKTYKSESDDIKVAVPQVPQATQETEFSIDGIEKTYYLPNAGCYNTRNAEVRKGLTAVRSLGVDSCLVDSYSVPREYISFGSAEIQRYEHLTGVNDNVESGLNPLYTQVKNNKALSGQFQKYVLLSVVSGDMQYFEIEKIVHENKVTWNIMCDMLPDGRPLARPRYYYSHENDYWLATVRGEQWQKNPIAYTGNSGQLVNDIAFDRQQNVQNMQTAVTLGMGGTSTANNAPVAPQSDDYAGMKNGARAYNRDMSKYRASVANTAISAAGGTAQTGVGLMGVRDASITHFTQRNIVAPQIKFSRIYTVQNYIGNFFYDLRYRLSDSDLIAFDNFLTQYGYAVFEPLTKGCFSGRKNFNYIEAKNVLIRTPRSRVETTGATMQLTGGVRIWHVKPSNTALYDNPITGGTNNVV